MTHTPTTSADLTDFEAEFATQLALAPEAQDLLFRSARTANTFTDEPVSDEQLRAIYELIKYAPTAANSQPLRYLFLRSQEAKDRLVPLLGEGNRAKTAAAPLVAILAADTCFHEELPRVFPHAGATYKEMYDANDDARVGSARMSAALQVGYFILGVRAAGLAAGPMSGFDAAAVSQEFFPDGQHQAMVIVNIGQPGEGAYFERNPRLSFDEVASFL